MQEVSRVFLHGVRGRIYLKARMTRFSGATSAATGSPSPVGTAVSSVKPSTTVGSASPTKSSAGSVRAWKRKALLGVMSLVHVLCFLDEEYIV